MKTYFLLSDLVMVSIITGGFAVVLSLVTLVLAPLLNTIISNQKTSTIQFDGMKDELMNATKLLGEATGKAQGRAELREEQKDDSSTPSEVIITENKDKEVIIKKNLDK